MGHWGGYLVAAVVVATRQHALFILYHDATHYHLTRRRSANDFLINLAIGVPGLVPIEFYRPLHLAHHRHVGTAEDPERNYLYHAQPLASAHGRAGPSAFAINRWLFRRCGISE
ncbi:fatty acid desaturase [Burkholderia cenocepacia]|uniref:fatty acid desaturase n=1 Tax=Burkholderia cenocepacia TaxID=95486 RepID=UPI0021AB6B32|nr:fatty acid desaturase [Burkholderia cenocepacia]